MSASRKLAGHRLGRIVGMPDTEYHRGPGISKSGLDRIHRSPEHYMLERKHPKPAPEWAPIGRAVHCIVLEGQKPFEDRFVMIPPDAPKRPTAAQLNAKKPGSSTLAAISFWDEFDAEHEGKKQLSTKPGKDPFWNPSQWCQVMRMRDALLLHPDASIFLNPDDGVAEHSFYWLDKDPDYGVRQPTNRLCKCRFDFINEAHRVGVDLKSTLDASLHGFTKSAAEYRYNVQDAWYMSGYYQATGQTLDDFIFVVVEKQPPYGVGLYSLGEVERKAGRSHALRDLDIYDECMRTGVWPGYPEGVRRVTFSQWQLAGKLS